MKNPWLDAASLATLILTLILFVIALFEHGLSHDLSLEAGVFLVSIKLVLASHRNEQLLGQLDRKIEQLLAERN